MKGVNTMKITIPKSNYIILPAILALATACSSIDTKDNDDSNSAVIMDDSQVLTTQIVNQATIEEITQVKTAKKTSEADLLTHKALFFKYDNSSISSSHADILTAHANFLLKNRSTKVLLAGHTDERGTKDYNLALGERRAQSSKEYLINAGVEKARISVISYGEAQPALRQSGPSAWRKNRRVEIIY
jgi:peptidoglycan-associated lipoprotein